MGSVRVAVLAVALFGTIALAVTSTSTASDDGKSRTAVERARKTLLAKVEERYGLSVPEGDKRLRAIQRLTKIGSPEAVDALREFLTTYGASRELKQHALTALGRVGTKEAVEAIGAFEAWAAKTSASPPSFQFGEIDNAIDHFGPHELEAVAEADDDDGSHWALVWWPRFGDNQLWLTMKLPEGGWSDPLLLGLRELPEEWYDAKAGLSIEGDLIRLSLDDYQTEWKLADQQLDSDKDGLTDVVELALATDSESSDSDGDKVPDGQDLNPLTPKQEATSDEIEIRQAVFSVLFATCNSRDAIVLVGNEEFTRQEYCGYGGPIIRAPQTLDGFVNIESITVEIQSPESATASIADWEGSLAASTHEAKLRKIHGKWVIVNFEMTGIS